MRNASAVDSSASEEVHFPCVSSWAFLFSLPFKTGQKRLPYFPEVLLFVLLLLLVVSFYFSAEMFRIFKER